MANKKSKFQGIFQDEEEPVIESETTALTVAAVVEEEAAPQPAPAETPPVPEQGSEEPRRVGRPATGKKSDTETYRQVTAYVRKDRHDQVKRALFEDSLGQDKRREFSELVDELLEQWLQGRAGTGR